MPTDADRVKNVFLSAAAKPPADRAVFLDETCGPDRELRAAVDRLLAAHDRPDSLLDRPVNGFADENATLTGCAADPPEYGEATVHGGAASDADVLAVLSPPREPGSLGRLDHYEALAVVGRGGMGIVLKARDTMLQRVVAVKLLSPSLAAIGSARQRFAREARAAAAIRDEHVVGIHAVQEDGPVPYLVMEYINGKTLEDRVRAGGPVNVRDVLRIGIQAARGLAAAHAQGLVHRDVKPANILLENGVERVKLTDFGLARAVDDASLTQSGVIAGTPLYMSPEQARGDAVDHRSDLFSLGSVLYTLCAGRPAFRAGTTAGVIRRVCDDAPRPIREVSPDVPAWVCGVVSRLMEKNPAERFQTATEVADLLGQYLAHLQQPDRVPPPAQAAPARSARRWKLAAAAFAFGMAGAVALYLALSPREPTASGPQTTVPPKIAPGDWKPRPLLTPAELAKLHSPLDGRTRAGVPADLLALAGGGNPALAPAEVVAVLAHRPLFALPGGGQAMYPSQTRDGRLLALPRNNDVVVFDAGTGAVRRVLTGHKAKVDGVAFSPDGRRLAAGSSTPRGPVLVWDVETGERVLELECPAPRIHEVTFSPDGKHVACAGDDGVVRIWDAATGKDVRQLTGPVGPVYSVAYEPDGRWVAGTTGEGTVWVWDPRTGEVVRELSEFKSANSSWRVAVSADGKWLAAGTAGAVKVWDTATWVVKHTFPAPGSWVAFAPDSRTVFAGGNNCKASAAVVARFELAGGTRLPDFTLASSRNYMVYHLSPDGKTLFNLGCDPAEDRIRGYDAESGRARFVPEHAGPVACAAFDPAGRVLATGGRDGAVRVWDLAGWKSGDPLPPVRVLPGRHGGEIWSIVFGPDGGSFATSGPNREVVLWDITGGRKPHDSFPAFVDCTIAFSPDGQTVAVPQESGAVELHDAETGTALEPLRFHSGPALAAAFSPDGRLLASSGVDKAVRITDLATRRSRRVSQQAACHALAFSPDGKTLVGTTDAPDARLRVWDVATGKEVEFRTPHQDRAGGLAIHPAGRTAATVDLTRILRVWDLASGGSRTWACAGILANGRQCVGYSPDGRYLATVNADGVVVTLRAPEPPPAYDPGPARPTPDPVELARRPAPADALKRENIPAELLKRAGRGNADDAPKGLVAVLGGESGHTGQVFAVAVSLDGRRLASAGTDASVRLWDLGTGKLIAAGTRPGPGAYSVAFTPDAKTLITGWRDGFIDARDAETGGGVRDLAHHGGELAGLAVSPDGSLVASAGKGGTVRVQELKTATVRRVIPADPDYAWCVSFSPDGKTLAVGGEKGPARLFDVASGWELGSVPFAGRIRWVGFHPDGRSLAVAGWCAGNDVVVWDLAAGAVRVRLTGHRNAAVAGAWRADGRLVATAGIVEGTVVLWDPDVPATANTVLPVTDPTARWLHGLDMTPEGRHVVTANPDGTVYVLRLAPPGDVYAPGVAPKPE